MFSSSQPDNSFRIGRFFGIDLYIDPWIVAPFLFVVSSRSSGGENAIMHGVLTMVIVFVSVLLHEYGHALAARSVGVGTSRITLGMLGGVAMLENQPRSALHDLWITIAGPLVNVVIWALCSSSLAHRFVPMDLDWFMWLAFVAQINLMLLWFNLIPAFPMDGGRILHGSLLLGGMSKWHALYYASIVAVIAAVGMAAWGIWDWLVKGYSVPIFRFLIAYTVLMGALARLRFLKQIKDINPELAPGAGQI